MQNLIDIRSQLENSFFLIFKEAKKYRPDRNRSEFFIIIVLVSFDF